MSETTPKEQPVGEQKIPQPAYRIFGQLGYNSPADLDNFTAKMSVKEAIFILTQSAVYAQAKGAFSLEEAAVLAQAVKIATLAVQTPPVASEPEEAKTDS